MLIEKKKHNKTKQKLTLEYKDLSLKEPLSSSGNNGTYK